MLLAFNILKIRAFQHGFIYPLLMRKLFDIKLVGSFVHIKRISSFKFETI